MAASMDETVDVVELSLATDFHFIVTSDLRAACYYENVLDCAKKLTAWLKNEDNREVLPSYIINDLGQVLDRIATEMASVGSSPAKLGREVDLATEGLRCLRNACASCVRNQAMVNRWPAVFDATKSLFVWSLQHLATSDTTQAATETGDRDNQHSTATTAAVIGLLRSGLQFLGNAVVGQEVNSQFIWEKFSADFSDILHCPDILVCDYVAMVIYNIIMMHKRHIHCLASDQEGHAIVVAVFDHLSQHNSHWCLYILQTLLTEPHFVHSFFPLLQVKQRQLLLEVTLQLLELSTKEEPSKHPVDDTTSHTDVAAENIEFICAEFKTNAYRILGLHRQEGSIDDENVAMLTVTYLDVLCSATANHHGYHALRSDVDLLKCSINLLHCTRMIGLEGNNIFSNVSKLADSHSVDTDEVGHPILGLKKNLIRLVGNMSYGNRDIQDEVRRLGGIPLIMDHMKIDARNKFITQWAVVAVRNLCENNAANQAVIADTKLHDIANHTQLLQQFGVDAQICNDKIIIKKAETNNLPPTSER